MVQAASSVNGSYADLSAVLAMPGDEDDDQLSGQRNHHECGGAVLSGTVGGVNAVH